MHLRILSCAKSIFVSVLAILIATQCPLAQPQSQQKGPAMDKPWMDKSLSPDQRADMVIKEMTLDEKIQLVHGAGWGVLRGGEGVPTRSNLGAGFVAGIDRLGIPDINLADSAVGIRMAALQSRYATLLPSVLGLAATWDTQAASLYGSVIGRELRDQGFNMSIGGGVDLAREPRNGRNFEYAGEDPILAGTMVGELAKGVQSQQVMGDIKHYALNDQETGRNILSANIDKRSMRETDLLAFQIAIGIAHPAGVMCAYNKINGDYACENDYTLNQVLKKDFDFKGFVLSDWDGTHSTVKAALAGLDQEEPGGGYFGAPLKAAVENGEVPMSRLDDMVHRILRSMFAAGVIDNPPVRRVVNPFRGLEDSQHIAEESIVLLKNADNQLPLNAGTIKSIALIGSHADVGILSGGGSAQVDAPGGNAIDPKYGPSEWGKPVYFPSSPLKYIRMKAPRAKVEYDPGTDSGKAASLAKDSDVVIVFVNQWMSEGSDAATLSLPDNQDALVDAVVAANSHTIVVIESGGPVTMPWADKVTAVLESWYPGIGGAQAIANIIFGDVNPSGKLPITFAKSDEDLPHPKVPGMELMPPPGSRRRRGEQMKPFNVNYTEGLKVGYKWFEAENRQPLFAFGHGLSYTTFEYSNLKADAKHVSFTLKNAGERPGAEVAQVYLELPASAGEPFKRLVAWQRVELAPGESKEVASDLDPLYLLIFDADKDGWQMVPGEYKVLVGGSSQNTPLKATFDLGSGRGIGSGN
ncbi:MAG: beta-glucosidase family protein [Terriglobales bacterium]|jgi:beta-glucosidase|nr:glycoside hydrolase family 3 C-terminal domain-containing protein [Terriglobales bacterium]